MNGGRDPDQYKSLQTRLSTPADYGTVQTNPATTVCIT